MVYMNFVRCAFLQEGERDKLKAHAENQDKSLNGFINRAIREIFDRDSNKTIKTQKRLSDDWIALIVI